MRKIKLGIDVSKKVLDCYDGQTEAYSQCRNEIEAIKEYLSSYDSACVELVVEPTGSYHSKLCEIASSLGYRILIANPQQSSYYMKVLKVTNKTDQSAAKSLALLAMHVDLPVYQAGKEKRKQLRMVYNSLKKQQQRILNQLECLQQYVDQDDLAQECLKQVLRTVETSLEKVEEKLHKLNSQAQKAFYRSATSVVGIGKHSAHGLLYYTNGLQDFQTSSQLVKFVGIAPHQHFSGSSVHKRGKMGKNGPSVLRACLYNAAKSAKRFNHACKMLYQRMRAKGKPHKVAMVAIVRKLLRQVFAVVKANKLFDNDLFNKQLALKKMQAT